MKTNFCYDHLYWDLCWLPFWMYWIYHPVDWISKLGSKLASRADHWILQSLSVGCNNVKTAIDHFLIAAFSCTHFDLQNFFSLVVLLDTFIVKNCSNVYEILMVWSVLDGSLINDMFKVQSKRPRERLMTFWQPLVTRVLHQKCLCNCFGPY